MKNTGARNAYALLGLAFLIVFVGAYILYEQAHAPTLEQEPLADDPNRTEPMTLTLTSPTFEDGATIPAKYTCDGENISPPLSIGGIPDDTRTLVLVMDDPDIPQEVRETVGIEKFDHWAIYNIPGDTTELMEGTAAGEPAQNSGGEVGYTGPCPPPQYEPTEHRYIFRLYALPEALSFDAPPTLDEVEITAKERALDRTELVGLYDRAE